MKHINDTSDMCPECTGSGMSCGEACHLCWGSGKYNGNARMLDKPSYEEQLNWLDLVGLMATPKDKEMIKAIKENIIAVRNYEAAIGKELEPVGKDIDQAFEDLVAFGEASVRQPFRSKQAIDHCHTAINNLKKWKSQSL